MIEAIFYSLHFRSLGQFDSFQFCSFFGGNDNQKLASEIY